MFKVVDYYDNIVDGDLVGESETREGAIKIAKHYYEDEVDGECELAILDDSGKDILSLNY